MPDQLISWAQRLQALSQTGLTYATDGYDRQRYEEIGRLAAEMLSANLGVPAADLRALFAAERGYATPKVDVRGVIIEDGRVLLVRERSEGLWTLPGGWADVGETPSESVEKEIREESGYTARTVRLLALLDRDRQGHPPIPFHTYKAIFRCEITGGAPAPSDETDAVDWFTPDALPPLSVSRVTELQIHRFFELAAHPEWPADFD